MIKLIVAALLAAPLMFFQPVWAHTVHSWMRGRRRMVGKFVRQAPIIWSLLRRMERWSCM